MSIFADTQPSGATQERAARGHRGHATDRSNEVVTAPAHGQERGHEARHLGRAGPGRLGQVIGAPRRLGLDFMLAAFCTTTAVTLWRGRRDVVPLAVAAITAIASEHVAPGHWHILAGGLAGSLAGAWRNADPT